MNEGKVRNHEGNNKKARSTKCNRTIYVKKIICKKEDMKSKYTNLYKLLTSGCDTCPYILKMDNLKETKKIGLIVLKVEVDIKEEYAWAHLMWCDESKIEVWDSNIKSVDYVSPPEGSEFIQGEKILLILKDQNNILTCGNNFSDSLALKALFEIGKNKDILSQSDDISVIQGTNIINVELLRDLMKEGIKSCIVSGALSYKSVKAMTNIEDIKSHIEFKDIKAKNENEYAMLQLCFASRKKGFFKSEYLSVDFLEENVINSPEDEEPLVIKTESGRLIKHGDLVLKNSVKILRNTDGMEKMDYADAKSQIFSYYRSIFGK